MCKLVSQAGELGRGRPGKVTILYGGTHLLKPLIAALRGKLSPSLCLELAPLGEDRLGWACLRSEAVRP